MSMFERTSRPATQPTGHRAWSCAPPILWIACAAFAGLLACQPAAEEIPSGPTAEENRQAIRSLVAEFMERYNGDDPQAFADLFTEDAIRMPPNQPDLVGKERIYNNTVTIFEAFERDVTVNVEESVFHGDFAITRGTWAVRLTPKSGAEATEDVGKWLNVSVRGEDGRWRISRNIWNSDLPESESS